MAAGKETGVGNPITGETKNWKNKNLIHLGKYLQCDNRFCKKINDPKPFILHDL